MSKHKTFFIRHDGMNTCQHSNRGDAAHKALEECDRKKIPIYIMQCVAVVIPPVLAFRMTLHFLNIYLLLVKALDVFTGSDKGILTVTWNPNRKRTAATHHE